MDTSQSRLSVPETAGTTTLPRDEIAAIRRNEGQAAAAAMGGTFHCLEERDLAIHYEREVNRKACALLRDVRPDLVITHYPSDYMIDHEETSRIARAACFNAPIPNAPCSTATPPLDHIPHLLYADAVEGIDPSRPPRSPRAFSSTSRVSRNAKRMLSPCTPLNATGFARNMESTNTSKG